MTIFDYTNLPNPETSLLVLLAKVAKIATRFKGIDFDSEAIEHYYTDQRCG
jgi:hypothetical protein